MEGNTFVKSLNVRIKLNPHENELTEENAPIEKETNRVKVIRFPTAESMAFSWLVIVIFLIIGGFISWVIVFTQESTIDQEQITILITPPKIQSTKQFLLNYFMRISNSKTISGTRVTKNIRSSHEGFQKMQKIAGVSPGIITTEMPNYDDNDTQWTSFTEEVISNWNNRHLVQIVWWDGNPLNLLNNFTDTTHRYDTERRWRDLIIEGGELNKVWKKQLEKIVPYLDKLQSAGVVPIFDILPIINNKGFIWMGRPGVTGSAKLYQITHDYLTKHHNLTSLIWSWSLFFHNMDQFEEFWPGTDYVDVAAVVMWTKKELPMSEYERLINLVGDKPLSMEEMYTVPSVELLTTQPRWTWFTAIDVVLDDAYYNSASNINATLSSTSVINKGNIDFFNDHN